MSASTSPLPYTGNKSCIVNTILTVMPKHSVYIEPCMGSAEVFFRKSRAEKEILNDYNGDLVNLFRVIQDNEKLAYLLGRLFLSINSELVFKQNKERLRNVPNANLVFSIIAQYFFRQGIKSDMQLEGHIFKNVLTVFRKALSASASSSCIRSVCRKSISTVQAAVLKRSLTVCPPSK